MKMIMNTELTPQQIKEIEHLKTLCEKEDKHDTPLFLESELNEFSDFPCFFLLYSGFELVSFLSVFIPDSFECEIYACTRPDMRKKGFFSRLFETAITQLEIYDIPTVLFVNSPESRSGVASLISIGASYQNSEYVLKFDNSLSPSPDHYLDLQPVNQDGKEGFFSFLDGRYVGKCLIDSTQGSATIHGFEIMPVLRGAGYGRETLHLVLEKLISLGHENILLHLSGSNKAAYRLYTTNGFKILHQIDYWAFHY